MQRLFGNWGGQGRSVALLSGCWALATTGNVLLVSTAALTGYLLAPDKALATLPIAFQWFGTAGATIPASFLMRRIGRRQGFGVGACIGITGAAVTMAAIFHGNFALLCLGIGMLGAFNGFNTFYRFAAAEIVSSPLRARAISLTLSGGVVAAVLGPALARSSVDLLAPHTYMGGFAAIIGLALLMLLLLSFLRLPSPSREAVAGPQRGMAEIARQPVFVVAILAAALGYTIMVLLMSVTPLAMVASGHSFGDASLAIQWHVLGMYAPSFFTGHLIRRLGVLPVILAGTAMFMACIAAATAGTTPVHFWIALGLLGVGWNFCYVGGTTLLTEAYTPAEMAKTQGLNDFMLFGSAGLGTFLAGGLLHLYGWTVLNLAALPLVLVIAVAASILLVRRRRAAAAAA